MEKQILLIDDDELVLKTIERYLKTCGYTVITALNGDQALQKAQKTQFDLIISDVRMPGMNGIETLTKIRKISQTIHKKSIPEIIITGYADENAYQEATANLGNIDYLHKPFDISDFINLVKTHLGQPAEEQQP